VAELHGLPPDDLLKIYYYLRLTRASEDRVIKLYRQGRVFGGVYVSNGQEAISVGSAYALAPEDVTAPSHRDLGANYVRGLTPREYLAQYLGRATGPTRGRDGNVHYGDIKRGILCFVSPMADLLPVAAGCALAFKIRREPRIAVGYFGDGASSRGDFHEAVNFAAVLRLPVLFICNNNQFAYSTPLARQMAVPHVADRAKGYGLPAVIVDGNDVLAVYTATKAAAERARAGEGPTLIECKTMRMRGHAEHDDAFYVPPQLLEEWRAKDPIQRLERTLREAGILSDAEEKRIAEQITREVEDAVQFAEQSPLPDGGGVTQGVYAV